MDNISNLLTSNVLILYHMVKYLTTNPQVCVRYEMVDSQRDAFYNHLISNKYEWNNCFY